MVINMSKFAKGEIVIFISTDVPEHRRFIGEECEVLDVHTGAYANSVSGHNLIYETSIEILNGLRLWCIEECLRKKKPPKEELGSWEDIQDGTNWNPTKEKEHVKC